jgi:hypothetical protein
MTWSDEETDDPLYALFHYCEAVLQVWLLCFDLRSTIHT